jgi:dTDP-4-amino-4,6-dideoxygalactose transaminase
MIRVPFNVPPVAGREIEYLTEVLRDRSFSANGKFAGRCQAWLKLHVDVIDALLTHSCTAALEMAGMLSELETGDEVIMPSFSFVSTANAVVLRRAVPVFVDIRPDTLNLDETLIEAAITPRTKAVCVVHYAGVCAEMDMIRQIAERHCLIVIEDAAQALLSTYRGRPAGQLGDLACFSFHETKNVTAGEGGALTINNPRFQKRAYTIGDKGTNSQQFRQGLVDKYSWIDVGSSFLPSEFMAAILLAQLEEAGRFCAERRSIWDHYHFGFARLEADGFVRRPIVPAHCAHNSHLYYLLLPDQNTRDALIADLAAENIGAPFHYTPLHSAPAGLHYARAHGALDVTDRASATLIRLPVYAGMSLSLVDRVIDRIHRCLAAKGPASSATAC